MISKGGNHMVMSELETFGLNSVWIYRNWRNDLPYEQQRSGSGIDASDIRAIQAEREALGVSRLTPLVGRGSGDLLAKRGARSVRGQIIGGSSELTAIANDRIIAGRALFSTDIDQSHAVVLLAPDIAGSLFEDNEDPIGQSIAIGRRSFQIVGLLAGKSRDFLSAIGSDGGQNANNRIIMPYTTLQRLTGYDDIGTLQLEVVDFNDASSAGQQVIDLLGTRHAGAYDYQMEVMASYVDTTNRILGGVAIVGIVAASISLLVGGMGIMSLMSTAVLERTREIGIRKAIGASEKDILRQFLFEAALISIAGGALGLLIGTIVSMLLAVITGFPLTPSFQAIAAAMLVSIGVGLLSGLLPARRASRLPPVEALRTA
jgi:ABC-type antimicrobial peptide transport system permease subunit